MYTLRRPSNAITLHTYMPTLYIYVYAIYAYAIYVYAIHSTYTLCTLRIRYTLYMCVNGLHVRMDLKSCCKHEPGS